MELNYFKDQLFDLLNESELDLAEIESDERANTFTVYITDGSKFELECRAVPDDHSC